ncbi:TPA_exp: putative Ribosome biogenesis protein URB1 [Trichophyton benhamiae CBS 112371]|nr:TPA_exp: putative Ribosome biogenesis protein URB1 [Trichophyton benhamiae CBS 112371]
MASFDDNAARAKRRKIDGDATIPVTAEITSYQQLRDILRFQQNISQETKQGIRHFKEFLASIQGDISEAEKSKKLQVLQKYCASQYVKRGDETPPICFTDLVSIWNFAESNNEESTLSLIPSVLASFLKTISSQLEFREFSIELSKYLLSNENIKLINRGLTASKSKEHLISPCLRLLTEIVSFDGGAVAKVVYAKRDITLKRLDVFLTMRKLQAGEIAADRRKPTLRRIAQRYLLANLRYQSPAAKAELLSQGKLIKVFIEDIKRDSGDIVVDIIKTLDKFVVSDPVLSRSVKSRLLSRWNLERFATLYGYEKDSEEFMPEGVSVSDEIHKFLLLVCTNVDKGVLLSDNGWYSSGNSTEPLINDTETISLGLDAPSHFDKFNETIPIRNGNLSTLIQFLRPESDTRQMQLLLKIFRAAPELVYDYFSKRNMFNSDPKPTQAWLGESAFLFSIIQLPVPQKCGFREGSPAVPPPNTEIVTLFAIKATTAALRKLRGVLKVFDSMGSSNPELWSQASTKLMNEFTSRCPTMKDTIIAFRQSPKDDLLQRDALLELLSLYYQVAPTVAFEQKLDVSLVLVEVLDQLSNDELSTENRQLLFSQLQHTLAISQHSPAMRWWQKPAPLTLSVFTSVLKVAVEKQDHSARAKIYSLLQDVLTQDSILVQPDSFEALVLSIQLEDENIPLPWSFIDNCFTRLAKRPVPYLDQVSSLPSKSSLISPILVVISEQWPFIVKAQDEMNELSTAAWISKLLGYLKEYGEDKNALTSVRDTILSETKVKKCRSLLKKAFDHGIETHRLVLGEEDTQMGGTGTLPSPSATQEVNLSDVFGEIQMADETHAGLHKWEREDLELAIDQGYIGDLILCVCSEHEEVRRQAMAGLSRFMAKLKESSFEERQAIYILIGELLETVKGLGLDTPAPFIVGELAVRMLAILTNPSHKLYGKINTFLNRSPQWEVGKIPSYWIDKILYHEPESDDGNHEEIGWLLDLFVCGLKSELDMDIYRRAGVFERLFSLYSSPALTGGLRKKVLHLVYRVCEIGGSTTLITRAAALSWVQGQAAISDAHSSTLRALATELYRTSSSEWVDRWSGSALAAAVMSTGASSVQQLAC